MHDGSTYVAAVYLITGATLALWFWMITRKLARTSRAGELADASEQHRV